MTTTRTVQLRPRDCLTKTCWEEQPLVPPTLEYRAVTVNQAWTGAAVVLAIALMVWFTTTHQQ